MLLANIVAKNATKLSSCQVNFQQVRNTKKTFRFRYAYGDNPLLTQEQFEESLEKQSLDELRYKPIRFALIWEYGSPLWDNELETFTKYVMKGGRKGLSYDLMHQTFYKIKAVQYPKLRKLREKENAKAAEKAIAADSSKSDDDGKLAGGGELELDTNYEVETNPLAIFKGAIENVKPVVITKRVKRGGSTYQVPYPVREASSEWFAIKWMISAVLDRPKPRTKSFPDTMSQELIDAFHNKGKVVKRKDDIHRLADANKAYSHYRWG